MGTSATIKSQEEKNAEFANYVDKQRADLDGRANAEVENISKKAKDYYAKFKDDTSLVSSNYRHLTTVKEWSLDSINQMINTCQRAIFGGPLPDGAKRDTPKPEVTKAIAAMGNLELLVANAAFDAVQGILSTISTKMTTEVSVKEDIKVLAPGLTLFVTVMENSYSSKAFLDNESILQTFFIFDARFSIAQGNAQSRLQDLQAYEEVKQSMRQQLVGIAKKIADLDVSNDTYERDFARFNSILDSLNDRLAKQDALMEKLREKPAAAMHATAPLGLPRTTDERLADAHTYAKAKSHLLKLVRAR